MKKEFFEEPVLEIVVFEAMDIIRTSGNVDEDGGVVLPDGEEF